jgi:hypothetical protein
LAVFVFFVVLGFEPPNKAAQPRWVRLFNHHIIKKNILTKLVDEVGFCYFYSNQGFQMSNKNKQNKVNQKFDKIPFCDIEWLLTRHFNNGVLSKICTFETLGLWSIGQKYVIDFATPGKLTLTHIQYNYDTETRGLKQGATNNQTFDCSQSMESALSDLMKDGTGVIAESMDSMIFDEVMRIAESFAKQHPHAKELIIEHFAENKNKLRVNGVFLKRNELERKLRNYEKKINTKLVNGAHIVYATSDTNEKVFDQINLCECGANCPDFSKRESYYCNHSGQFYATNTFEHGDDTAEFNDVFETFHYSIECARIYNFLNDIIHFIRVRCPENLSYELPTGTLSVVDGKALIRIYPVDGTKRQRELAHDVIMERFEKAKAVKASLVSQHYKPKCL